MTTYFSPLDDTKNDEAYIGLSINILDNRQFEEENKSGFANISDQQTGRNYHIPFALNYFKNKFYFHESSTDNLNSSDDPNSTSEIEKPEFYPIDEFFAYIEKCRINRTSLHLSEIQYFTTKNNIDVTKSGIELDFDIFQKQSTRVISDVDYNSLISEISEIIGRTLDLKYHKDMLTSGERLKTAAVVLRKDKVVPIVQSGNYKNCYKESFHIRFPGVKVSKGYKRYLIREIKNQGVLHTVFDRHGFLNIDDNMLDENSAHYPAMILGSMKRGGKTPHEFYMLFDVTIKPVSGSVSVNPSRAFDQTNKGSALISVKDPENSRKTIKVLPDPRFDYNLCHECSLLYEAPGKCYIKKREFKPAQKIKAKIKSMEERLKRDKSTDKTYLSESAYRSIQDAVSDITVVNYDARFMDMLLELINIEFATDYDKWKRVIRCIAMENDHFKPLAIKFSSRCPEKFTAGGEESLDSLWDYYISRKDDEPDRNSGMKILKKMAREDNAEKYEQLRQHDVFATIGELAYNNLGDFNENEIANILAKMYRDIFVSDRRGNSDTEWFQFVLPDQSETQLEYQYKWRSDGRAPDGLDYIISEKFGDLFRQYIKYLEFTEDQKEKTISNLVANNDESNAATNAQVQKIKNAINRNMVIKKNIRNLIKSFGTVPFINRIISRAGRLGKFRRRGFIEGLDKDPTVIGVGNGVLKLSPEVKLIQEYHDILVSRFTTIDYHEYDPDNLYIKETEEALKNMFILENGEFDEESYEFIMMYLASSLDGKEKEPIFMILLGEGSNGKSMLMELHLTVMREVTANGYGNKMNTEFFTSENKARGGPDSEKMTLEFSRYTYLSESARGDKIKMERVKEVTGGESISGSEKHEKQKVFRPKSIFLVGTNYNPQIEGSDHGTWRRILTYTMKVCFTENPDPELRTQKKRDDKWRNAVNSKYYTRAYLSILVHFYKRLQMEHGGKILNVPHQIISKESEEYRKTQDYYGRFMMEEMAYIGQCYPGTREKVKPISIEKVAKRFAEWYSSCVNRNVPRGAEVIEHLRKCSEHFEKIDGKMFLMRHEIRKPDDVVKPDKVVEYDDEDMLEFSESLDSLDSDLDDLDSLED